MQCGGTIGPMPPGAGPWYSSAALSTTLSAAGVLTALAIGVIGFRFLRIPLQRFLVYSVETNPLLAETSAILDKSELRVIYRGEQLPSPYLISFSIVSRSRIDISGDEFFRDSPLVFDLGTPVTLLDTKVPEREDHADDWFSVEGSNIQIGPAVIRRGKVISLELLANGPPRVKYQNPIAGVRLREEKRGVLGSRLGGKITLLWILIGATLAATNVATGLVSHYLTASGQPRSSSHLPPDCGSTATACPAELTDPHSAGIAAVAFIQGGHVLAVADDNGHIYLWTVATGALAGKLTDPRGGGIASLAVSANGSILAVADDNGQTYLWRVATRHLITTLPNPGNDPVKDIAFSPNGSTIAAAGASGSIYLWNISDSNIAATLPGQKNVGVFALTFSPDNRILAAATGDGYTDLWSVASGKMSERLTDPTIGGVWAVTFISGGRLLATADGNGPTYIWSVATGKLLGVPLTDPEGKGVYGLAVSPDGRLLATGDHNGSTYLWVVSSHNMALNPLTSLASRGIASVAFSPDGHALAAGGNNGVIYIWQISL
jgi:dipeptidyl aminopeptidase/acylaminoacyl peptidase